MVYAHYILYSTSCPYLISEDGEPLLQGQLEPVAHSHTVAAPITMYICKRCIRYVCVRCVRYI